jgi:hypothetical protein
MIERIDTAGGRVRLKPDPLPGAMMERIDMAGGRGLALA